MTVRYRFERPNQSREFSIEHDRNTNVAVVQNIAELTGPRDYVLDFVGEVLEAGVVTSRYLNTLYVFVSRYKF